MKNNKMGNKLFLLAMLGMVLALGLGLTGCKTDADDDDSPTKPTALASDATHARAMAKLDEIIAYSGTPAATKSAAETVKTSYNTSLISTNWSAYQGAVVTIINNLIDSIP